MNPTPILQTSPAFARCRCNARPEKSQSSCSSSAAYTPMQLCGHGDDGASVANGTPNGTNTSFVRAFAATECALPKVGTFWIHVLVCASITPSDGPLARPGFVSRRGSSARHRG